MSLNVYFFVFCLILLNNAALAVRGTFRMRLMSSSPAIVRVCLKEWQWAIVQDGRCSLGKSNITLSPEREREIQIPFIGIWPVNISIIVDGFNGKEERIGGMAWRGPVAAGQDWTNEYPNGFNVSYRFECQESFYGSQCKVMCIERDNFSGHYTCGSQGEKICKNGWTGQNCNEPVCESGCVNGTCIAPNTCSCKSGFTGSSCSVCIPHEDCIHGTCANNKPFTCACKAGWTGHFCDEDLHFCSHHTPCQNGGTCMNGRLSRRQRRGVEYTCTCPSGFGGANCETKLTDQHCGDNEICYNGGECVMAANSNSTLQCRCPSGFVGPRCQYDVSKFELGYDPCAKNPCQNGATCGRHRSEALCQCSSPCYSGPFCSIVNQECLLKESKNFASSRSYVTIEKEKNKESKGPLLLLGMISLTLSFLVLVLGFFVLSRRVIQLSSQRSRPSNLSTPTIYKIDLRDRPFKDAPPPYYQSNTVPTLSARPALFGDVKYVELERRSSISPCGDNMTSTSSLDPLVSKALDKSCPKL
ncbi:unnamed protein product [Auanema sp. JU1783]|nr:unnamed protein product [Auanema sp. JU1783]